MTLVVVSVCVLLACHPRVVYGVVSSEDGEASSSTEMMRSAASNTNLVPLLDARDLANKILDINTAAAPPVGVPQKQPRRGDEYYYYYSDDDDFDENDDEKEKEETLETSSKSQNSPPFRRHHIYRPINSVDDIRDESVDIRRHEAIGNLLTLEQIDDKKTKRNDDDDDDDDEGTIIRKGRRRRRRRTGRLDARFEEWLRKHPERAASYCDNENNNNNKDVFVTDDDVKKDFD